MRRALIVLALTLLFAPTLMAQTLPVRSGDRVMLRAPGVSGVFTVDGASDSALSVRNAAGEVSTVPVTSLSRVRVSLGARSRGRGALRMGGFGLLGGVVTGVVMGLADGDDPPAMFFSFTAGEKAVMAGSLLGAAGGLLGGVIGAIAPGERWQNVSIGDARAAGAEGGVSVSYNVRF
jgi:hypothetical protein